MCIRDSQGVVQPCEPGRTEQDGHRELQQEFTPAQQLRKLPLVSPYERKGCLLYTSHLFRRIFPALHQFYGNFIGMVALGQGAADLQFLLDHLVNCLLYTSRCV